MGSVAEISELLIDTCYQLDAGALISKLSWDWNSRFTSRMGDASWPAAVIRLSSPLWPRASIRDRRETVIHELCHLVTGFKYGTMDGHGPRWQSLMIDAGCRPARRHQVCNRGLVHRVRAICDCQVHEITSRRAAMIERGDRVWVCRSCRVSLAVEER